MKKLIQPLVLALILFAFAGNGRAQTQFSGNYLSDVMNTGPAGSSSSVPEDFDTESIGKRQGAFFISPFYQFTRYKDLELKKHSNHYKLYQGEYTYTNPDEEINEYNNNYDTEYENNMTGVRIGYQVLSNLGVSASVGIDNFTFKSWISNNGTQYHSTSNPAVTLGATVDYETNIYDNFYGMALFSYNYCNTSEAPLDNTSGEEISSADFTSNYWEINLVVGYPIGKFLPFAGAGFTQMFVNSVHEELIPATDDTGADYINRTEFDSEFEGSAFYGFAGVQYFFTRSLAMYARSSFPNPLRASVGFKIIL